MSSEDEAKVDIQGAAFESMRKMKIGVGVKDERTEDEKQRYKASNDAFALQLAADEADRPESMSAFRVAIEGCASGYVSTSNDLFGYSTADDTELLNIELYEGDTECKIYPVSITIAGMQYDCSPSENGELGEDSTHDCVESSTGYSLFITNNHSDLETRVNDDTVLNFNIASNSHANINEYFTESETIHVISDIDIDETDMIAVFNLVHKEVLFIDEDANNEGLGVGYFRFVLRCKSGYEASDDDNDADNLEAVPTCGSTKYSELAVAFGAELLNGHNYQDVTSAIDTYSLDDDTTMSEFKQNAVEGLEREYDNVTRIQLVDEEEDIGIDWDDLNRGGSVVEHLTYANVISGQPGDLVIDIECDACFDGGVFQEQYLTLYRDEGVESGIELDVGWGTFNVMYNS